jgi:DNA modification methylase
MSAKPKPTDTRTQIEHLPVEDLIPYAKNSRTHSPEQTAQIAASIREFGFTNPVLIGSDNDIIAGHGRVLAARKLGLVEVPCIRLGYLTDAQKRAYVIADNKLALNAGWDEELLKIELAGLRDDDGFDLGLTGFSEDELSAMFAEEEEIEPPPGEDETPEPPSNPITTRGDIWKIGDHRILCGDCRDFNDVEKLLGENQINVAVTSPPYASQRKYDESSGFKPIPHDEYVEWYRDVAANIMAKLAPDGSYFCNIKEHCEDGQRSLYVKDLTIAHVRQWGWMFVDEFCWRNTKNGVPGGWNNRFKNAFEPIFHFAQSSNIKFNPDEVSESSNAVFEYSPDTERTSTGSGFVGGKKAGGYKEGKARPSNVLEIAASAESDHSAAYPVPLPEFFIKAFSDAGDIIFDPFMGSGTTMIAAEKNGRVAFGTEISPQYCDVIVMRWQNLTGKQAVHADTGKTFDEMKSERDAK